MKNNPKPKAKHAIARIPAVLLDLAMKNPVARKVVAAACLGAVVIAAASGCYAPQSDDYGYGEPCMPQAAAKAAHEQCPDGQTPVFEYQTVFDTLKSDSTFKIVDSAKVMAAIAACNAPGRFGDTVTGIWNPQDMNCVQTDGLPECPTTNRSGVRTLIRNLVNTTTGEKPDTSTYPRNWGQYDASTTDCYDNNGITDWADPNNYASCFSGYIVGSEFTERDAFIFAKFPTVKKEKLRIRQDDVYGMKDDVYAHLFHCLQAMGTVEGSTQEGCRPRSDGTWLSTDISPIDPKENSPHLFKDTTITRETITPRQELTFVRCDATTSVLDNNPNRQVPGTTNSNPIINFNYNNNKKCY